MVISQHRCDALFIGSATIERGLCWPFPKLEALEKVAP